MREKRGTQYRIAFEKGLATIKFAKEGRSTYIHFFSIPCIIVLSSPFFVRTRGHMSTPFTLPATVRALHVLVARGVACFLPSSTGVEVCLPTQSIQNTMCTAVPVQKGTETVPRAEVCAIPYQLADLFSWKVYTIYCNPLVLSKPAFSVPLGSTGAYTTGPLEQREPSSSARRRACL